MWPAAKASEPSCGDVMSTDRRLDEAGRRTERRVTLVAAAIVGAGLLSVPVLFWRVLIEPKERYKRITVGMTVNEVVALFGETHRHTKSGEPLKPPVVTVPAGVKYSYAYTWLMWDRFVYVLFDDDDRVVAVYT